MEPSPFYPSDDPLSRRAHAKQENLVLYANTGEKMFAEVPELIRAWPGNGVCPPCFFNDKEDQNMV